MQQIRRQVLTEYTETSLDPIIVPLDGTRWPPELYEHLYQAELSYRELGVTMHVTPVNIPVVGRLIEWIRAKIHALVLFYVNQLAEQQMKINTHLLHAVSIMAREGEDEAP